MNVEILGGEAMYDAIVVGARCGGSPTAMLLARKGYRVLLVDRAAFPSDTISTLMIWPAGISKLKRWGLLDRLIASNCPANTRFSIDAGDFPLAGWGPAVDGVSDSYAPRRKVLDKILVDAAVEAGAELREEFSVQEILTEDGKVTGIRGKDKDGPSVTEKASIVVGADGKNSLVARSVEAPMYKHVPALSCFYYTFWSGVPTDSYEDFWTGRRFAMTVPTNDSLILLVIGTPIEDFKGFRRDIEGSYMKTIDSIPGLSERIHQGHREDRFYGMADLPNFFRKPYGLGWALVGDAGYNKDPITAFGISDAFRDAELLADAVDAGLSGNQPMDAALADYERKRNEQAMPQYELTLRTAEYNVQAPRSMELRAALRGNQPDTDKYMGLVNGTVSREEFFDPENIQRIFREAEQK